MQFRGREILSIAIRFAQATRSRSGLGQNHRTKSTISVAGFSSAAFASGLRGSAMISRLAGKMAARHQYPGA